MNKEEKTSRGRLTVNPRNCLGYERVSSWMSDIVVIVTNDLQSPRFSSGRDFLRNRPCMFY